MINLNLKNSYFLKSMSFSTHELISRFSCLVEACHIDRPDPIDRLILFDPYFANSKKSIENLIELIQMEDKYCQNNKNNKLLFQSIEIYTLQFSKKSFEQLTSDQSNLIQKIEIRKYLSQNQNNFKFHDRFLFFLNTQTDLNDESNLSFYIEMNKGMDDLMSNNQIYSFNVKKFSDEYDFIAKAFISVMFNSKKYLVVVNYAKK